MGRPSTSHRRVRRAGTRPLGALRVTGVALVAVVATAVAACSPPAPTGPPPPLPEPAGGYDPNSAPRAGDPAYTDAGPYEVGVTTIEVKGRRAEVWYPVDPGDIGETPLEQYYIKDHISRLFATLVPADVNPPMLTAARRSVPASPDGPFPLVLFAHGFASYRNQSTFLTTHVASWGFVVVSPDYPERGLRSLLGEPPAGFRTDRAVSDQAIEAVKAADSTPGHLLEGIVDASSIYPIGHSAGGGTAIRLLARDDVHSAIPLASGIGRDSLSGVASTLPPNKAVTWIAAPGDNIASIDNVRRGFDYTAGERKLVEIGSSGHVNAFSDLCEIGDGGIVAFAKSIGIPVPSFLLRLGNDGCEVPLYKKSTEVWPEVRHFVTAELRYRSGLDPEPVGLGDQVLASFDDIDDYRHDP